jgi:hypothetical protein
MTVCGRCGAENPDDSRYCQRCGCPIGAAASAPPHGEAPPRIPNYLIQAILVTLCCCPPFGIVAIVYSSTVSSRLLAGDYAGAVRASRAAAGWCWAALIAGFIAIVAYFAFVFLAALSTLSSGGPPRGPGF